MGRLLPGCIRCAGPKAWRTFQYLIRNIGLSSGFDLRRKICPVRERGGGLFGEGFTQGNLVRSVEIFLVYV